MRQSESQFVEPSFNYSTDTWHKSVAIGKLVLEYLPQVLPFQIDLGW